MRAFIPKENSNKIIILYTGIKQKFLLGISFFILSFAAFAGGDGGITKTVGSKREGSQITQGPLIVPYTPETNEISSKVKIIDNITLSINESIVGLDNFNASGKFGIYYGTDANDAGSAGHYFEQTLSISYRKGEGIKYDAQNRITFEGAKYIKVIYVPSSYNASSQTINAMTILSKLVLSCEMVVTRYFDLSNTNVPAPEYRPNNSLFEANGEFEVGWKINVTPGNNATQVEWTWLDDEMAGVYTQNGVVNTDLLFRNNATRVDVSSDVNRYLVPLLYGNAGNLYYRVRFVTVKENGSRSDGPWSPPGSYHFSGHQNNLNWQATTTFAEEGKRKSVIQYYDGSLRPRQTVTKNNTDNTVVAAETIYDAQGRPAIQVLPSPEMSNTITYINDLNLFNGQTGSQQNPAELFDLQSSIVSPPLQNISGAARYYSASNPQLNSSDPNYTVTKAVPDAQGYPYTLTRYTPDGTGRVISQSGVGDAFKMGGGHETKYYYGSPSQEELDGLFGTEVGNAAHYFKNMVQDANGQMSVSYVDMHGRTIATALAGNAPASMQSLLPDANNYPGQQIQNITKNLLKPSANLVKNNQALESINTLLVPVSTTPSNPYIFTYKLTPDALQAAGWNNAVACYDCQYNLEISITNESGETDPVVYKFSNVSISPDNNCSTTPILLTQTGSSTAGVTVNTNTITISQQLIAGSYSIRKTLSIDEDALAQQERVFLSNALDKTEDQIIDSIYTLQKSITGCEITTTPPNTTCPDNICNTEESHILETFKQQMMADMIPYSGQYALNVIDPLQPSYYLFSKYNIFSNSGYSKQPYYRNPSNTAGTDNDYYKNIDGTTDPVLYSSTASTPILPSSVTKSYFTGNFSSSWIEQLLPYHPEYSRYQFAVSDMTPSYNWIDVFLNTPDYNSAVTNNYIYIKNGTNNSGVTPYNDPFYTKSVDGTGGTDDQLKLKQWVGAATGGYLNFDFNLWQLASGNILGCQAEPSSGQQNCYQTSPVPGDLPFNSLTIEVKNSIWNEFKMLYANERNNLVMEYIAQKKPLSDEALLALNTNVLHFPDSRHQLSQSIGQPGLIPTNEGEAPILSPGQNDITTIYDSRCSSYIEVWRNKLLQCQALAARTDVEDILDDITTAMVEVCKKGSDEANPNGSSNVPASTPQDGMPRSFEEVIQQEFIAKGIIGSNGIYTSDYCNPFVIDYPKPYNKGEALTKMYKGVIQECNYELFSNLQQEAASSNPNYNYASLADFNAFLVSKFGAGSEITQTLFETIRKYPSLKTEVQTGVMGPKPISYPEDMPLSEVTCNTTCNGSSNFNAFSTNASPNCAQTELTCPLTEMMVALTVPQEIPFFLQCGYNGESQCHTCGELQLFTAEFKSKFAASYNTAPITSGTLTDNQVSYNMAWARFLNYRTGLQETWQTYINSANDKSCNLTGTGSTATEGIICGSRRPLNDTAGVFVTALPCAQTYAMSVDMGQNIYAARRDQLVKDFEAAYRAKCLSAVTGEVFTVNYQNSEYHYTLYYYDQAGNLVKTIPPKGARPNFDPSFIASVESAKAGGTSLPIDHLMPTRYCYNSLNAVTSQNTPDGGTSKFWYDRLGRLVVSQNAKQFASNKWSYTVYDALGRITEVGQKPQSTTMDQTISQNDNVQDNNSLPSWLNSGGVREQITYTQYDNPYHDDPTSLDTYIRLQQNLRNRVSYTTVKNLETDALQYAGTFYTYDIHGNVDTLLQDYQGISAMNSTSNRFKRITYDYDLISGKVNSVDYQPALLDLNNTPNDPTDDIWKKQNDAFYHRYTYDAENRLTQVETSRDKFVWEVDAVYSYYRHGPLARTVLGALQVQGLDYDYTLQGWLKGVNGSLDGDGSSGSLVAKDAYSYQLNYFAGDYNGIDGSNPSNALLQQLNTSFKPLYNGNIAAMGVNISKLTQPSLVYNYGYDQLNRLRSMDTYNSTNNAFTSLTATQAYKEAITYDPNGNILTYLRNGANQTNLPLQMDNLAYIYKANTNQLTSIGDNPAYANNYSNTKNGVIDIENQSANNYGYDEIGNMTSDVGAGITGANGITWNVYGKILSITKSTGTISYSYDAVGNRISKTSGSIVTTYVRDAQGNVMGVYQRDGGNALQKKESHIYGSSRLGILGQETTAPTTISGLVSPYNSAQLVNFTRGEKNYELTNHLDNVLVTVSDKRVPYSSNGTTIAYFISDVVIVSDYYPFGMQMPGRTIIASNYRYGFNGKEVDNEIKGDGNEYDYGFRIYDPRIGKFLSMDPLLISFPWYTPYQFAGNMPIWAIDLDGLEEMKKNSSANVIRDIYGGVIVSPTIINNQNPYVDKIPGVKRINQSQIEVTPGLLERIPPNLNFNTFVFQQVNGSDFKITQTITPVGQDAGGGITPERTNLQQDNNDPLISTPNPNLGQEQPVLTPPIKPKPKSHPKADLPTSVNIPLNGGWDGGSGDIDYSQLTSKDKGNRNIIKTFIQNLNKFADQVANNPNVKIITINLGAYVDANSTSDQGFKYNKSLIEKIGHTVERMLIRKGVNPKKIKVNGNTDLLMNKPNDRPMMSGSISVN